MPLLQNAKKALRVSKKKAEQNRVVKSKMKTLIDKARKAISQASLSEAFSAIDRSARKHIIHPNKAARLKSQLSKQLASGAETPLVRKVQKASAQSKAKLKARVQAAKKAKTKSK